MMYSIGPNLEVVGHRVTRIGPLAAELNGITYAGDWRGVVWVANTERRPIGTPGLMWDSLAAVNEYRDHRQAA